MTIAFAQACCRVTRNKFASDDAGYCREMTYFLLKSNLPFLLLFLGDIPLLKLSQGK